MSEGTGRARGRGRGKPRGGGDGPGGRGGQAPGGPPSLPVQAPPPMGAWGAPRGAPAPSAQQASPAPQAPTQAAAPRAQAPAQAGRALTTAMSNLAVGDNASRGGNQPGRGNLRGVGRQIPDNPYVHTRPTNANSKKGTTGTPMKVLANYFEIVTRPNWGLMMYHVDFSPNEDRTPVRQSLVRLHRAALGGYIFDGTVLYTSQRIYPEPIELYSTRKEDDVSIRISLKMVGDVVRGDHHYIQVFNILMRRCYANLDLQLIGRDYFDSKCKVEMKEYKLEILPGYKTTINQYEHNILMVAEIAHKVVRTDSVMDLLRKHIFNNPKTYIQTFTAEIVGSVVMTEYNNKTYTVDDVAWDINPGSSFSQRGESVTYVQYYKAKYQRNIRDMNQPMLLSKAKARDIRAGNAEFLYLVPELSRMTGLSTEMRSDFRLMRDMAHHTRVAPDKRIQKLQAFNQRLQNTPKIVADLKEWSMVISPKPVEIMARLLPQETILLGPNADIRVMSGDSNDGWTREMRSKPMLSCANVKRWLVICPQRVRREAEGFMQLVMKNGAAMGFRLPPPTYSDIPTDATNVYVEKLEQVIAQFNPSLIVCVVTNDRSDRYSSIKKKCYVDRAVPVQVLTARSINNKNAMSIATKVAIQLNCKVGGAPWTVGMPLTNIMVVGYDVCHDCQNKSLSYGCMVASMDKAMTRYFSATTPHSNGEELSNEFGINMKKALHIYKSINGQLPSHIMIYRDGVGEGQIPYVYQHEVEVIKKALHEVYNSPDFRMGFIIVSKRLNTRFILATQGLGNPRPGTVIDDIVTSPERYDFFLISQAVRDGTVSPTSYNIISDSLGLSPDQIQRLTYKFCHTYYNFSGQVRVPAPCQYAHKLAFLTGQNLHLRPNPQLESLLYFL